MPRYVLSSAAERDIESILAWTHDHFGPQARLRYEALLVRAIIDVAEKPDRAGSHNRPEFGANVRTYHLAHSRDRVVATTGRVKHPRHCLLYRVRSDGRVEIGRVFHDSMDLDRYLPVVPDDPPKL
jgi:toxin ParE1/3/4